MKERGGDATLHPPTCGSAAPSVECSGNTDPSMALCRSMGLYGVFRLWTNDYARPGAARPEKRDGGNCVHADWTGGLADRHAVGVAGHDVPQTMTNHLYLHTNTVVSTRYTTCIYAHTSRVRAHGSFRA